MLEFAKSMGAMGGDDESAYKNSHVGRSIHRGVPTKLGKTQTSYRPAVWDTRPGVEDDFNSDRDFNSDTESSKSKPDIAAVNTKLSRQENLAHS